ncbi:DUF4209 domain-containing protein [Vibrio kanaloae]|nr:DUF4209 domain-containing protein [Vibrio kanaloae]TKF61667.1 DUF4209 domain-containing protein [Vibrio kanaloae]
MSLISAANRKLSPLPSKTKRRRTFHITWDSPRERSGIKALLGYQAIIDTLGSDITSNLQVILLDKIYGDLRNQLSHGYVSASTYWGTAPKYLWWLVLHMLMLPLARYWKENYKVEEAAE